jgi:hypothetical protein
MYPQTNLFLSRGRDEQNSPRFPATEITAREAEKAYEKDQDIVRLRQSDAIRHSEVGELGAAMISQAKWLEILVRRSTKEAYRNTARPTNPTCRMTWAFERDSIVAIMALLELTAELCPETWRIRRLPQPTQPLALLGGRGFHRPMPL